MSRVRADLLLLITAIIWGTAFLFQKTAMASIGPFTFIAARFVLSALVVLPFACREARTVERTSYRRHGWSVLLLCAVFFGGVVLQQVGMLSTTVTNAGFLTGLYAIFTPLLAWALFRHRPPLHVWLSALLCILGVWLLGDASFSSFNQGDLLVIACAVFFSLHTSWVSYVLRRLPSPLCLALAQYAVCGAVCLVVAWGSEPLEPAALLAALPSILFAGILSGGVAYTFQFIAQQHTPPSDAAIILSSESLFAALAGVTVMGDTLSPVAWSGCAVILCAILLIELAPLLARKPAVAGGPGIGAS